MPGEKPINTRSVRIHLGLLLLLTACATPTVPASLPTLTSPPVVPASSTPAASATSSLTATETHPAPSSTPEPASPARTHYDLRLTLDYEARAASVDETITYTNQTGGPLDALVLAVEPGLRPGSLLVTDLTVDGAAARHDFASQRMTVKLAPTLAAGQTVSVRIGYQLSLPLENQRSPFGYNADQINLLDWYPLVVPFVAGKGWVLNPPSGVGEHLTYESADFDVFLKLVNTTRSLVVAASAPGTSEGEWTHYRLEGARGFSFSVSDHFLTSTVEAGGVRVTSYYFDGHQAAGEQAAQMSAQAVALFSKKFAPYPYQSLSVVESATDDGMESDGLYFLAGHFYDTYDGTRENYLSTLSAHETAHQWWYSLVGNDQAYEPWLDESLATYSEHIFYQELYPDEVTWWWYFRIRRFDPSGAVDANVYGNFSFRTYTNAVYFMGAYFLDDLRVRIGDEAFYAAIDDYTQSYKYKIATTQDFFDVVKRHSTVDFSDLVENYFK